MICSKCGVELELLEVSAEYLGHHFSEKLPRCPECGQIFVSEELASGKIADVELTLEQK